VYFLYSIKNNLVSFLVNYLNFFQRVSRMESTIASCSKNFLDKIDKFYDVVEIGLSQTCDDIEELHLVLRKQCEEGENLLNSK
jgi:hypothetical protein